MSLNRKIEKWLENTSQKLDIRELGLTKWPKQLAGKEHLIIKLDCSKNELSTLPKGMTQLQTLFCYENQLITLPDGMTKLKTLFCYDNQLTVLPSDIIKLNILICSNNKLTTLPEGMTQLQILHCPRNRLIILPKGMNQLKELHCSHNRLITLLGNVTILNKLKTLNCSNNQLTTLSEGMIRLQELICSNNKLTTIIDDINQLQVLDCPENKLFSNKLTDWKKIWTIKNIHQQKLEKVGVKRVLKSLKNRLYLPRLGKLHEELIWSPYHPGKFFISLPRKGKWHTN